MLPPRLRDFIVTTIATAGGAGFTPKAPGTAGALVALPFIYFTQTWPLSARIAFWGIITAAGIWAGTEYCKRYRVNDHQQIVIDEVSGVALTAWTIQPHLPSLFVAFVLFRFFDIAKLPPVRQLDRWSKTQSLDHAGWGVMLDDLLAGVQGLIVMMLLQHFHVLP